MSTHRIIIPLVAIAAIGFLGYKAKKDIGEVWDSVKRSKPGVTRQVPPRSESSGGAVDYAGDNVKGLMRFDIWGKPVQRRTSEGRVITTFKSNSSARKNSGDTYRSYYGDAH
jgi:hypothetical protein